MSFNVNKYTYGENNVFIDIDRIKNTAPDSKCYETPYKIGLDEEYRPDIIAYKIYGDTSMATYIAIINDIYDSPEGFYHNRKIKLLRPEYVNTL